VEADWGELRWGDAGYSSTPLAEQAPAPTLPAFTQESRTGATTPTLTDGLCEWPAMNLPALEGPDSIADCIEGQTFRILTRILRARCPKPAVTNKVRTSADMLQAPFDECVEMFKMGKEVLEQWDARYLALASSRRPPPPPPPPPPPSPPTLNLCRSVSMSSSANVGCIHPTAASVPNTDACKTPKHPGSGARSRGRGTGAGATEKRGGSFKMPHTREGAESRSPHAQQLAGVKGATEGVGGGEEPPLGGWEFKEKPEYALGMRSALENMLMACFDLCRGGKASLQAQVLCVCMYVHARA